MGGSAASMVGMSGAGATMGRAATALRVASTVTAVGVAAAKNPVVRDALEQAKNQSKAQMERIGAAAERGAHQVKQLSVGGVMESIQRKSRQVQISGEIKY